MQSQQRATFGCTALLGTGKRGIMRPDADGYYKDVVLGGLDVKNSAGALYAFDSAKALFKESSSLMRRISNGALRGEYGHPRQQAGQTVREFMARLMDIYEPNVSHHIRRVTIDTTGRVRDDSGRPIIAILGDVKPMGPMGEALRASFESPDENVCFSIRSFTNDTMSRGQVTKHLKTIVTWDYVNEPGISAAKKWHAPGLESLVEESFLPAQLMQMRNQVRSGASLESAVSVESVIADFGWTPLGSVLVPPSSSW